MFKSIFRKTGIIKRPKIGLALGGGGARGLAHIGVLQIFEKEKIPIDFIAGTSIGSIVGAVYSYNPNADELIKYFHKSLESEAFKSLGFNNLINNNSSSSSFVQQFTKIIADRMILKLQKERLGVISAKKMNDVISVFLNGITFENTKIPFGALLGNMDTGKGDFMTSGNIVSAVQASSSIPGWVEPVKIGKNLYTDGMIASLVPISEVRQMGAEIVIAVDVTNRDLSKEINSSIDIVEKSNQIIKNNATDLILEKADIVIRPNTKGLKWYEYLQINDMIEEGKKATINKIDEIKKLI